LLRRDQLRDAGRMSQQPKSEPFVTAQMHFQACIAVRDFIENKVYPILNRDENVVLPARLLNRAMVGRALLWMRSLTKLNQASDSQAILAGSRALFELAVDYTLLKHETKGDFSKLLAWQESEKLEWAEHVKDHAVFGPRVAEFLASNTARIGGLRSQHWKGNHPMRWTGRKLRRDAEIADGFQPTRFVEYRTINYRWACWQIHGSGAIGLAETTRDFFPYFSAQGYADCARFAIATSGYALDLVGKYDPIVDLRFGELNTQIAGIQFNAMPPDEQRRVVENALRSQ
jgi:hypothetical protein